MVTINKRIYVLLSAILILTLTLSGTRSVGVSAQGKGDLNRLQNAETGRVSFIGPESGRMLSAVQALGLSSDAAVPADPAMAFANRYAPEFGITDPQSNLSVLKTNRQENGRVTVRYQQKYEGVPVLGGELIVNTDDNGNFYSMNGEASHGLALLTQPGIDSAQARDTALQAMAKWYQRTPTDFVATEPELWIFDESLIQPSQRPAELVWRMDVTSADNSLPVRELILINAQTSNPSLHFNQIDTAWAAPKAAHGTNLMTARQNPSQTTNNAPALVFSGLLSTYTANNGTSLPGSFVCNQTDLNCTAGDSHAKAAHKFAAGTYDLYLNEHNRNSINNGGMTIVSTVRYDFNYANAFWQGTQMVYGDGYGFVLADDVVGHELTHGVTQYESNLIYWYQSGAINESLSDVWGEYYDQTNGLGNDSANVKWLMGEDVSGLGAIRNMKNPPQFGDPDKMTSGNYYKGQGDNGGVHYNSGVNNKAVYLMVDGGTFNGKTMQGIGWDKTAAIYYEAQTNLLGSGSNYSDLYYALLQACKTLTGGAKGITLDDCINAKLALDAVQMNTPITLKAQIAAPFCPTGTVPSTTLFSDNMEGLLSTNWNATSRWSLVETIANSPTHSLYGDDFADNLLEEANMKTGVALPANSYLHFNHAYDFDYFLYKGTNYYYDGGVVEYSTNNGASWQDAGSLFSAGANYGGTIASYSPGGSALGGRKGFVGSTSYPYSNENPFSLVSTRYDLGSLAGQTVRFRFRFATDASVQFYGWHIDDVKIYTCLGVPSVPALQTPANSALVQTINPTLDWTDSTSSFDHYQLQISTDNTFASLVIDQTNLVPSQFVPALTQNTKYYWRVRSFNSEDATNNWSAVRNFRTVINAPTLASPADASDALTLRPTFDWSDASGPGAITGYTIQISKNNTFTQVVNNGNPVGSSYTPNADLPKNIPLFWRVRVNGSNGPSAWSAVRSFNSANSPSTPTLLLPANNSLNTNYTPLLKWKAVTLPAGTTFKHYQFQVDDNADFSSLERDDTSITVLTTTQFQMGTLAQNTKFYWRVRAVNTADEVSNWSSVWSFRTRVNAPTLLSPTDGSFPGTRTPTFDWTDATGPGGFTNYTIQVSTSPNFGSTLLNKNVPGSTYITLANLPAGKLLYWRVKVNGANGPSTWSNVFSFTTP